MNRLEAELGNEMLFLRVDIQGANGKEASDLYGSRITPTFILFDPQGEEIWRSVGSLDPEKVRESLKQFN